MPTPFSTLIDRFFRRIEEDKNYFDYYNLTNERLRSVYLKAFPRKTETKRGNNL